MHQGPSVTLQNVFVELGGKTILQGVDLFVNGGTSLVIVGPSGSGKTVLLKTIAGIYPPSAGSLSFERSPRMGMLFQKSALFDSLRVWENISFRGLQDRSLTMPEARALALEKLEMVGLGRSELDLLPVELSGGMQRRVGLARALADKPDLLLLDDPTAGLDPITGNMINDLIVGITDRLGATVLSVNSDMEAAGRIAQFAVMLHEGKIVWQGRAAEMRSSTNPYIDQLVNHRINGPIPTVTFTSS